MRHTRRARQCEVQNISSTWSTWWLWSSSHVRFSLYLSLLLYHHHRCRQWLSPLFTSHKRPPDGHPLAIYLSPQKKSLFVPWPVLFLFLPSPTYSRNPRKLLTKYTPKFPHSTCEKSHINLLSFHTLSSYYLAVAYLPTYIQYTSGQPTRVNTVDSTGWLWACVYHSSSSSSAINVFTVFALQNITISSASETPLRPAPRYQRHVVHKPCHTIHTIATAPRPGRYLLTQLT